MPQIVNAHSANPSRPRPIRRGFALMGPRSGFTIVELMVVIFIALLLLSIFIPFLQKTRETDNRVRCSSNLRALGTALERYSIANGGAFPRVVHDSTNFPNGYFAYTGPFAINPFAGDGRVSANDVTASLWLLVRQGHTTADVFICASSGDWADAMNDADGKPTAILNRSNFRGPRNLSYSYASPFSTAPGYRFANAFKPEFAMMADKNPGRSGKSDVTAVGAFAPPLELARANSRNHNQAGQNVLFADSHVDFMRTPYCGFGAAPKIAGDNIYTVLALKPLPEEPAPNLTANGWVGPDLSPAWKYDSYLVPTDDENRR